MRTAATSLVRPRRLAGVWLVAACAVLAVAAGASGAAAAAPCPMAASDLSAAVGRSLQRVNLSDPKADPMAQCAFAAVVKGKAGTPQVYLTIFAGDAGDLRDMSAYYVQARSKLATRPRVAIRSDLGPGAFTLTTASGPVTTLYVVLGKGMIGALTIDLSDAPVAKRDQSTIEKIFALALNRSR